MDFSNFIPEWEEATRQGATPPPKLRILSTKDDTQTTTIVVRHVLISRDLPGRVGLQEISLYEKKFNKNFSTRTKQCDQVGDNTEP